MSDNTVDIKFLVEKGFEAKQIDDLSGSSVDWFTCKTLGYEIDLEFSGISGYGKEDYYWSATVYGKGCCEYGGTKFRNKNMKKVIKEAANLVVILNRGIK